MLEYQKSRENAQQQDSYHAAHVSKVSVQCIAANPLPGMKYLNIYSSRVASFGRRCTHLFLSICFPFESRNLFLFHFKLHLGG